jgi:plasmid maintenance system antidote protein VapI
MGTKKRTLTASERVAKLEPGLSLRQLARRTGIALPHLSRVINGKRGLTLSVVTRIAKHTGVSIERVCDVLA